MDPPFYSAALSAMLQLNGSALSSREFASVRAGAVTTYRGFREIRSPCVEVPMIRIMTFRVYMYNVYVCKYIAIHTYI